MLLIAWGLSFHVSNVRFMNGCGKERESALLSDRIFRKWGSFTSNNFYVGCRVEITGSPQALLTAEFARAPGVQRTKCGKHPFLPSFLASPLSFPPCLPFESTMAVTGLHKEGLGVEGFSVWCNIPGIRPSYSHVDWKDPPTRTLSWSIR